MRLIDADALYKELNAIRKEEVLLHGRSNNKDCCTLSTALYEIEHAPTIEPETEEEAYERGYTAGQMAGLKKSGKWQYITDGHFEYFKCDQCGKHSGEPTPFCRYCGTNMEEGE